MSMRPVLLLTVAVLAASPAIVCAQPGKTPAKIVRDAKSHTDMVAVLRQLQAQINTPKEVRDNLPMDTALEMIENATKAAGVPLTIVFDFDSLRKDKEFADIFDGNIPPPRARPLPARMTLKMLLEHVVAQSPGATYVIRQGRIDVVNVQDATAQHLIKQPVLAAFDQRPLHEVLSDLSDLTGLSINLDPSVGDKTTAPISAVFRNNVTLDDALINVTEMAGLKFVVLPQTVYVTTPQNAAALAKEQKPR